MSLTCVLLILDLFSSIKLELGKINHVVLIGLQRVPENPRTRPETVVTRPDPSKDFDLG